MNDTRKSDALNSRRASVNGSVLLRAAKRARKAAQRANEADREFTRLYTERYGEHHEMPDELVEVVRYGNGSDSSLTLELIESSVKLEASLIKRKH